MASHYVVSIGSSSAANVTMAAATTCALVDANAEYSLNVPKMQHSPSNQSMNTNCGSDPVSTIAAPSMASVEHETVQHVEHSLALTVTQRVHIAKVVREITSQDNIIIASLSDWCAHVRKPVSGDLSAYTILIKKVVADHYDDLVELKKQLAAIKDPVEYEKVVDNIANQVYQMNKIDVQFRVVCDVLYELMKMAEYIQKYPQYNLVPVKTSGCCVIM